MYNKLLSYFPGTSSELKSTNAHHSPLVSFVWIKSGTQLLATALPSSGKCQLSLSTREVLLFYDFQRWLFLLHKQPIGFQRAYCLILYCLILYKWKSLPIVRDQSRLLTALLSSREWKAWKARACSLSLCWSTQTQAALRKHCLFNKGSMPRIIVAPCHFLLFSLFSLALNDIFRWQGSDMSWMYMLVKCYV